MNSKINCNDRYDLLLVNPPANIISEPDYGILWNTLEHTFTSSNVLVHAINHGILSIATYCDKHKYRVKILDMSNDNNFSRLEQLLSKVHFSVVGVSSQSGFDYLETLECLRIIKEKSPNSTTVAGGQHIGMLGKTAFKDTANLDILCIAEGEKVMIDILMNPLNRSIPGTICKKDDQLYVNERNSRPVSLDDIGPLRYHLYPNVCSYTPIVEESRGCPFNCNFCVNRSAYPNGIQIKNYARIYDELLEAIKIWGKDVLYVFSAANFGSNINNTLELMKLIKPLNIKWTCQFRVDSKIVDYLDILYDAGLVLLALGLESVNPETLRLMNKTKNPSKYIADSIKLLEKASQFKDLVVRLNFILYIGTDNDIIQELLEYLLKHRDKYEAVYVTPVYFNPGTELNRNTSKYIESYGVDLLKKDYWESRRLFFCNPSPSFSFVELINFATILEKIFRTEEGWERTESIHFSLADN